MKDSERELFAAYAEYVGRDIEQLDERWLDIWDCDDCGVSVPIHAGDPQAYGPVLCPECGKLCKTDSENETTNKKCKL